MLKKVKARAQNGSRAYCPLVLTPALAKVAIAAATIAIEGAFAVTASALAPALSEMAIAAATIAVEGAFAVTASTFAAALSEVAVTAATIAVESAFAITATWIRGSGLLKLKQIVERSGHDDLAIGFLLNTFDVLTVTGQSGEREDEKQSTQRMTHDISPC